MSCGSSIKQIEVKEISDVQFMGIKDNQIVLKSELILYNPNNKNLRASQVYSKIYFNTKFFGEFEMNFDGFVKISFPNKKFKFNLDYELDSKLLTEKFLNNL